MNTAPLSTPSLSSKPIRLRGLVASDIRLSPEGVAVDQWTWWFAAPGHRDLWVAVGRTRARSAAAARKVLRRRALGELTHPCTALGVPWALLPDHAQPIAELQLISQQARRSDLRDCLRRDTPAAAVDALRDALLDDATRRRPTPYA